VRENNTKVCDVFSFHDERRRKRRRKRRITVSNEERETRNMYARGGGKRLLHAKTKNKNALLNACDTFLFIIQKEGEKKEQWRCKTTSYQTNNPKASTRNITAKTNSSSLIRFAG
jgi:hypothetical protein